MKSPFFFNLSAVFYFVASVFSIGYLIYNKKDRLNTIARFIIIFGLVIHTIGVIFRIIESGHAPFANLYESITYFSWSVILLYLYMEFKYQLSSLKAFIIPLSFLALIYANTLSSDVQPLVPALQSIWLEIHVAVIFIGYAAFAISYGFALVYILKVETEEIISSRLSMFNLAIFSTSFICLFTWDVYSLLSAIGGFANFLEGNISGFSIKKIFFVIEWVGCFILNYSIFKRNEERLKDKAVFLFAVFNISFVVMAIFYFLLKIKYSQVIIDVFVRWVVFFFIYYILNRYKVNLRNKFPAVDVLDRINYRAIAYGFPFLTGGIIAGAVWANEAWGSYWSWDPKETWSLVTWFIYAAYLHARITVGWKGVKSAYISIYGFWAVVFTYFGVSLLLSGLHSYG